MYAPLARRTTKAYQHRSERSLFPSGINALFSPWALFDGSNEFSVYIYEEPLDHRKRPLTFPFGTALNHRESGIAFSTLLPYVCHASNMLTGCLDDTCLHIGGVTSGPLPDLL